MSRFGHFEDRDINKEIENAVPKNTKKSQDFIWNQFMEFCAQRNYKLEEKTPICEIAKILKDWAFNMKQKNGQDYKESTIKTIWNGTAKLVMTEYFQKYKIKIDPFQDVAFKEARDARNAKRKMLQGDETKRKVSATALKYPEFQKLVQFCHEDTPDGLQKKFFFVLSYELAWRGGEGCRAMLHFFKEEVNNLGQKTGRIEYNPVFAKTTQGGSKPCASSKWLVRNKKNPNICPVRLFTILKSKREGIENDRLFLTVNPSWKHGKKWFKNLPVGVNEMSKWTMHQAKQVGLDVSKKKFSNHSLRATAVSNLAKSGVAEQELIKITGHGSSKSIASYLQMDQQHHETIIAKMRGGSNSDAGAVQPTVLNNEIHSTTTKEEKNHCGVNIIYNNCTINYNK